MIHASGEFGVYIDLGNDELGMTLQHRERGSDWADVLKDGQVVK